MSCLPSTETDPYTGGLEMWEEPRHQLVLSKDSVKVMDVLIPGGDTSLFHVHRHPTIYVLLNGASYGGQNWGKEWEHSKIMDIAWAGLVQDMSTPYTTSDPPVYHRVTVPDDETYHLIAMVNTGQGEATSDNSSRPVKNRWFRENRYEIEAGERSDMLRFENPVVLVQYSKGNSSVIENGVEHSHKSEKGGLSWHDANTTFQISNNSDEEIGFVVMEMK